LLHWQLQLLHFGAEGVGKAGLVDATCS